MSKHAFVQRNVTSASAEFVGQRCNTGGTPGAINSFTDHFKLAHADIALFKRYLMTAVSEHEQCMSNVGRRIPGNKKTVDRGWYVRWIMSRNRADGPNQCIAWTGSHRVRNGIGSTVYFRQHLKRERGEEESLKLTLGSQSYA